MRCAILATLALCGGAMAQSPTHDAQAIFAAHCYVCHGPKTQMAKLRLDDLARAEAVKIKLIARITSADKSYRMPPAGPPLSADEISTLRAWAGPGLWSLQPIRRPAVPAIKNESWARNPIDRFVAARLEKEGIQPSPEADRNTLIRRVSLDLTGLPPTPAEEAAFAADTRPDAYERLVDRLLASPHYGEKWARTWLDLAHYADSDGYEKDLVRPWAWRYRQWVIDALNRDMPYDKFTIEQLAGDLLPGSTVEQKVATGFLRNTLTNREAGVDRMEARFDQIVSRTNTTAIVWLGLTVGCAQCHNHKFDPIPQKDYYRLFAFFNNTEEQEIEAPLAGQREPYDRARPEYDRKRNEILAKYGVPELQAKWEPRIQEAFKNQGKDLEWDFAVTEFRASFDGADKFLKGYWTERSPRDAERLTDYFIGHRGPDYDKDKAVGERLKQVREQLAELSKTLPEIAMAPVIRTDPVPVETNVHLGGDYQALGDRVEPATLSALPPLTSTGVPDRLALARWIVSRENPLTARVAVNRMWQEFFGRGLVVTSEDFGTQGDKPSHPELLDWLASEFVDRGWRMKQMHKLMVMSATYRQASSTRKDIESRDPDNTLLARQTRLRLPAELVRDETLAVSGLLNPEIGGKSVRPPQPAGVAELGYANSVKWVESTGPDRYRRGLYIHFQRTTPYPMLMNFDEPDSNTTCTRRRRSNTPLQALNLLNDPVFFEAAQALAARVVREAPALPQPTRADLAPRLESQLDYAFELCTARKPNAHELDTLAKFYTRQNSLVEVARVLLNLDEFITRE